MRQDASNVTIYFLAKLVNSLLAINNSTSISNVAKVIAPNAATGVNNI